MSLNYNQRQRRTCLWKVQYTQKLVEQGKVDGARRCLHAILLEIRGSRVIARDLEIREPVWELMRTLSKSDRV